MRHILATTTTNSRARTTTANAVTYAHIIDSLRNPDPEGPFAKKARLFKHLPETVLIWLLYALKYEGLVFLHEDHDTVIGNIYCQAHRNGLHLFGIELIESLRGTGYSLGMLDAFLVHAWERGWRRIRLGTTRTDTQKQLAMASLRRRYFEARRNLPFVLVPDNDAWVTLCA